MVSYLQLLQDTANIEKQATLPAEWIERRYTDTDARTHYLHSNDGTAEGLGDSSS